MVTQAMMDRIKERIEEEAKANPEKFTCYFEFVEPDYDPLEEQGV